MPGRKPLRDKTMTGAERQARFRAAHADGSPKVRYRRPGDRRSRPQRWRDAVAELVSLQEDYRAGLDSLPTIWPRAPPPRRCGPSAKLTCRTLRAWTRRAGLDATDRQRDRVTIPRGHCEAADMAVEGSAPRVSSRREIRGRASMTILSNVYVFPMLQLTLLLLLIFALFADYRPRKSSFSGSKIIRGANSMNTLDKATGLAKARDFDNSRIHKQCGVF